MRSEADAVIVGAGATGLGTAYHLAKAGLTRIVVVDKSYLNYGATARNGGGVRAQWTTEGNIRLAKASIRMFKRLSAELGHNIFFRQGGYLFLARNEKQAAALGRAVAFQNRHGVRSRLLPPRECRRIAPDLDTAGAGVLAGSYNPEDAVLFPWPLVWGYHERCREMGVQVEPFNPVSDIRVSGGKVREVVTAKGTIRTPLVLNATGAWVNEIGRMVGVELPIHPEKHEILVSSPLKPFLKPMVVDLTTGLYASQSMRGEIVGGISEKRHERTLAWGATSHFLRHMAATLTTLLPRTRAVGVMRQWAGSYDMTPDAKPIIEEAEQAAGYFTAAGFSGHGIMVNPITSVLTANLMMGRPPPEGIDPASLSSKRFQDPGLEREQMVIG